MKHKRGQTLNVCCELAKEVENEKIGQVQVGLELGRLATLWVRNTKKLPNVNCFYLFLSSCSQNVEGNLHVNIDNNRRHNATSTNLRKAYVLHLSKKSSQFQRHNLIIIN